MGGFAVHGHLQNTVQQDSSTYVDIPSSIKGNAAENASSLLKGYILLVKYASHVFGNGSKILDCNETSVGNF